MTATPAPRSRPSAWRVHAGFLIGALVCVVGFGWMITYGTGRIIAADSFGVFYDYQAQAWLHGRWDVPEKALSGEAFVVAGKVYGYFGPTPALMRLPLVAAGLGFGELTRAMMIFDYVAALVAAYLLLRQACRLLARPVPQIIAALFTVSTGLGSTVFFLGSRPYVYHEAILCGLACALWSTWFALRYLESPRPRWWIAALGFGTLAVQARPPMGLFALVFLAVVVLVQARRSRRWAPLGIAVAAFVAVQSFNAVGYLKFGVFEGCPLRFHVQYTPQRLAAIDGRNFHASNLRFNADSYFWRSNVSVRRQFPFLFVDYLNRTAEYPESKTDYRDPTLAIPYAMPSLTFLVIAGSAFVAWRRRVLALPLSLLWVSAIPVTFAMLTAVAVTQRYTAEFCAFLIPLAAYGAAACAALARPARIAALILLTTLTVEAAGIEFALTLYQQRAVVWGAPVDAQEQYRAWQQRVDHALGPTR
jgi:hypothetical protein